MNTLYNNKFMFWFFVDPINNNKLFYYIITYDYINTEWVGCVY